MAPHSSILEPWTPHNLTHTTQQTCLLTMTANISHPHAWWNHLTSLSICLHLCWGSENQPQLSAQPSEVHLHASPLSPKPESQSQLPSFPALSLPRSPCVETEWRRKQGVQLESSQGSGGRWTGLGGESWHHIGNPQAEESCLVVEPNCGVLGMREEVIPEMTPGLWVSKEMNY